MGKRIKCPNPKCGAETLNHIRRVDRPGNFFTVVREYKCLHCPRTWWVDKSLAELRRDKYIAEHCGSGRYPYPELLNKLELAYAKELVLLKERNRKYVIRATLPYDVRKDKRRGNRSKLSFYLPDPPKAKH